MRRLTFPTVSAFKSLNWGNSLSMWGCQVLWIGHHVKHSLFDNQLLGSVVGLSG